MAAKQPDELGGKREAVDAAIATATANAFTRALPILNEIDARYTAVKRVRLDPVFPARGWP